jgi:hypothetical protein
MHLHARLAAAIPCRALLLGVQALVIAQEKVRHALYQFYLYLTPSPAASAITTLPQRPLFPPGTPTQRSAETP